MKLKFTTIAMVILLACGGYVSAGETEKSNPKVSQEREAVAPEYCPICGPEEEMHGLAFGYRYKGKKYKFCSMECLKAFKANPEKFLDDNYMAHGHDGEDHAGHDHGEHEKH